MTMSNNQITSEEQRKKQRSLDNLIPFKPGQSGNPNGRPKGTYSLTTIIRKLLQDEQVTLVDGKKINAGEALTRKVLKQALEGDTQSLKLIFNYVEGMPVHKNEISTPEGIRIEVEYVNDRKDKDAADGSLPAGEGV